MSFGTPNSYLVEQTVQPLSINSGTTALPVFVGYTRKAVDVHGNDLTNVLTLIGSLLDYEAYFGGAELIDYVVHIDEDGTVQNVTGSDTRHYLHQSIDLYFRNGGGSCFVLSIGNYSAPITLGDFNNGLTVLKNEDEPTLLVFTDAVSLDSVDYYALCRSALAQCNELKDRFVILDVKDNDIATFRESIGSDYLSYGAAYYPYLDTVFTHPYDESQVSVRPGNSSSNDEESVKLGDDRLKVDNPSIYADIVATLNREKMVLPPGSVVAAAYSKTDTASGPWKAPANVMLNDITGPTGHINNSGQESLNNSPDGKSINAIRSFINRGTLIWGARTLDGNNSEWRYISVRRLFIKVESEIKKATAFSVFEPNNSFTWLKIKSMLISYLEELWSAGALNGATAEEAYFVRLGLGETMDDKDIQEGRLHISVGIAAVRPAEFVVMTITHILQGS